LDSIERRVRHCGRNTAGERAASSWSYDQLWNTAQANAEQLIRDGCGGGGVVAIYGSKKFSTVAAVVAGFLARATIMPFDARLPERRKKAMVAIVSARHAIVVGDQQMSREGRIHRLDPSEVLAPAVTDQTAEQIRRARSGDGAYI